MKVIHRMIIPISMDVVDDVDERPIDAKLYLKKDLRSNMIRNTI